MADARSTRDKHEELRKHLIWNEIPCTKYNYTVDSKFKSTFDHYKASFRLTPDGKGVLLFTYRPEKNKKRINDLSARI